MKQKLWNVNAAAKLFAGTLLTLYIVGCANKNSNNPVGPSTSTTAKVAVPLTPAQKQQAAKIAKEQAVQAKITAQHQKDKDAKAVAQANLQKEEDAHKQAAKARQQEEEEEDQAKYNQTHYKNDGLTLDKTSVHGGRDDSGEYVTGKVKNDSGSEVDYAEISYKETDNEGNQIGTARDNITHLSAGATWKFKCMVLEEGVKRVDLDQLKTTPL